MSQSDEQLKLPDAVGKRLQRIAVESGRSLEKVIAAVLKSALDQINGAEGLSGEALKIQRAVQKKRATSKQSPVSKKGIVPKKRTVPKKKRA